MLLMRARVGSLFTVILAVSQIASAQTGAGSNVIISSTFIAQVRPTGAGEHTYNIFEDTRNASRQNTPALLRFYLKPMFLPERYRTETTPSFKLNGDTPVELSVRD
jgi:hypothetical protein